MRDYNGGFSKEIGLFKKAEKSKVNRNFIWFCILAYLLVIASAIIPTIAGEFFLQAELIGPLVDHVIFGLTLSFGALTLVIALIVTKREKRSFRDIGFQKYGALKSYLRGFGVGLLLMGVSTLIIFVLGGFKIVPNTEGVGIKFLPTILFTLIGWIIQGGTEEVLCRGWMLPLMGRKYNVPFAVIVTSLFFMLLHSSNNAMSLVPILSLIAFGIFAALYVVKEKSLWGVCGLHTSWNWMQGNILGVEVSGSISPGGSLIKLQAAGNPYISGGSFGVEGSIICTVVFMLASVYLFMKIKNTEA
ncbi:type II CAAX endopeptidase family protein [Wukongibacter baidiensis]|uniref:CPBP family intramembrane glutamic endopeptidase n=1 Tax=Wukongibacter baidiensis TaxID=1723361 RepID=UPI003D7FEF44